MTSPASPASPKAGACRFCAAPLEHVLVDLGMSPLCESYLPAEQLDQMEPFYPLRVDVCDRCFLAQLPEYVGRDDIFREYAYFSAYSDSWVEHARRYTERVLDSGLVDERSLVMEVASNDGYLLQHFVARGVPVLGIEPAINVAEHAIERDVPTITEFFGQRLAQQLVGEGRRADLLAANNVLAQVPDLNDFVGGMATVLAPTGVLTIEFPHLLQLVEQNQFDTIYHEHFSYFSFTTSVAILAAHGLTVYDVDELSTHGGSLRLWARHEADGSKPISPRVDELLERERLAGMGEIDYYRAFARKVEQTKRALLAFLVQAKDEGASIVGYGAPGKGNTLLNYCGIRTDFLDFTVDRNPYKQGLYTPGTHIPILHPDELIRARPDYVFILPWNLREEITDQLAEIRSWGGRFVVPIPALEVF